MRRNIKALARRSRRKAKALSRRRSSTDRPRTRAVAPTEVRRSRPHPVEEAPARAAWAKHASAHPFGCPPLWAALVGRFGASLAEPDREAAMATVLIALGEAHSERNLLDGEWIAYATVECYLHFDGSGGGEAAVLGILEQFVDWLSREWRLEAWLRRKLHHELDDAREVHGLARRHPAVVDRPFGEHELEVLTTRFVETAGLAMHPISRSMSGSGVRYLHSLAAAHHGDAGGGWARFGSIDLDTTLAEALTFNQFEELHGDVPGPTETFLEIGAHFYRWLAAEGYLDPERADEIAHRFSLSLSLEPRFTPAA